jgi:hypothetical protein
MIHKNEAPRAKSSPIASTLNFKEIPGSIEKTSNSKIFPETTSGTIDKTKINLIIPAKTDQNSLKLGFLSPVAMIKGIAKRETSTQSKGVIEVSTTILVFPQ